MMRLGRTVPILLVFSVLVSASCARTVWTKTGLTEEEFRVDDYACERDMRQSGYFGTGLVGAVNARGFYERCMQAKGYRKVRENYTPAETYTPSSPQPQPTDVQCPGNTFWNGYGCTAR